MILGDFNADGSYVTNEEMKRIRIYTNKKFHWLIGDDVDTTAKTSNDHTYDRSVYIVILSFMRIISNRKNKLMYNQYIQIIGMDISLTGLLCMGKTCWQLLCQTQPSHSISTKSMIWQKKW